MIQRIQSVYFLLACILMVVTVFSPLLIVDINGLQATFNSCGVYTDNIQFHTWGVITVAGICGLLPLINIFLFKRRKVQIKVANVTSILILFFFVTLFAYFYALSNKFGATFVNVQYGIVLPLVALIFNMMAVQKVKKDESLIKSLNRIR